MKKTIKRKTSSETLKEQLVYLPELDSALLNEEDKIKGERRLFNALLRDGKTVVMTYNQITDSLVFLSLIEDEKVKEIFLSFIKEKRIQVSQYKKNYCISKYVLENFSTKEKLLEENLPVKAFHSSYVEYLLREEQTNNKDMLYDKLINAIGQAVKFDDLHFVQGYNDKVKSYVDFIIQINLIINDNSVGYKLPIDQDKLEGKYLQDYFKYAVSQLPSDAVNKANVMNKITKKYEKQKNPHTRSAYLETLKEMTDIDIIRDEVVQIINHCYNEALEFSILGKNSSENTKGNSKLLKDKNKLKKLPWDSAFRICTICKSICERKEKVSWQSAIKRCIFIEMIRVSLTTMFLFVTVIISYIMGFMSLINNGFDFLLTILIALAITWLGNYICEKITDRIFRLLPNWTSQSIFQQLKQTIKDARVVHNVLKNQYDTE